MNEGRDLKSEINELGIVAIEDIGGLGSRESTFAAMDAIREHNKQFPEEKLATMVESSRRTASESMAGTRKRKGEN